MTSNENIWSLYYYVRAVFANCVRNQLIKVNIPQDRSGNVYEKVVNLIPGREFRRAYYTQEIEAWEINYFVDINVNYKLLIR